MKYFLILLLLIAIGAGGYFFFYASQTTTPATQTQVNPDQANCSEGINGNSGDNYCSNYRGPGSKCTPRMPNTYPDGCSK